MMDRISRVTLLWIMGILLIACFAITWKLTNDHWKIELVKRGHAHWVVKNESGAVEWQWIQPKADAK